MDKFLYKKFLTDKKTYRASRAFWYRKIKRLLPKQENLIPYLNERFKNKKLFYDGNPIINLMNEKTRKGIRIIQESPEEFGDLYQEFHIDNKGENSSFKKDIDEKLIILTLTRDSISKAETTILEWLQD